MSKILPNPHAFLFLSHGDEQNAPEPQRFSFVDEKNAPEPQRFCILSHVDEKMLPNPDAFYF